MVATRPCQGRAGVSGFHPGGGGDPEQDAEPGKILHEIRSGEMAALKEIPRPLLRQRDATPLFVLLAGAYYERTGDRSYIASLWPHVEAALHWIDRYGDWTGWLRGVSAAVGPWPGAPGVEGH